MNYTLIRVILKDDQLGYTVSLEKILSNRISYFYQKKKWFQSSSKDPHCAIHWETKCLQTNYLHINVSWMNKSIYNHQKRHIFLLTLIAPSTFLVLEFEDENMRGFQPSYLCEPIFHVSFLTTYTHCCLMGSLRSSWEMVWTLENCTSKRAYVLMLFCLSVLKFIHSLIYYVYNKSPFSIYMPVSVCIWLLQCLKNSK